MFRFTALYTRASVTTNVMVGVMYFQGFNWESHAKRDSHRQPGWLQQLAGHAAELAECGVTAVWLPPPCHSIAEQGYMPQVSQLLGQTPSGSKHDAVKGALSISPLTFHLMILAVFGCTADWQLCVAGSRQPEHSIWQRG